MEPHDYERFGSWQDDARVRKWYLWGYEPQAGWLDAPQDAPRR